MDTKVLEDASIAFLTVFKDWQDEIKLLASSHTLPLSLIKWSPSIFSDCLNFKGWEFIGGEYQSLAEHLAQIFAIYGLIMDIKMDKLSAIKMGPQISSSIASLSGNGRRISIDYL